MIIKSIRPNEFGYLAIIERASYVDKDGNSVPEIMRVQLPYEAHNWSRAEAAQFIKEHFNKPRFVGVDIDIESTNIKSIFFDKLRQAINDWKRVQDVRIEAQTRGLSASVITDLQKLENNNWQVVVDLFQKWRAAT